LELRVNLRHTICLVEIMKVVIVCWDFNRFSILRQPWRHVYEISRRMVKRGIATTIISDGDTNVQPHTEMIDGIRVHRISHRYLVLFFKKGQLLRAILKEKPDVVIWWGDPLSTLCLPLLKIGKPVIWSADNDFCSLKTLKRISLREILYPGHTLLWQQLLSVVFPKFVIRKIANSDLIEKILVPSKHLKDSLSKIGIYGSKIKVIPSAIDEDYFSSNKLNNLRTKLDFSPDNFIITYFGSPCTLRGTDTLIRSVPKVLEKTDKINVVILSRRGLKENLMLTHSLEEVFLKKLAKRVGVARFVRIIPGVLSRKKLKEFLCVSDVIVLPFKLLFTEVPLSILEAMALGKVVITTNIGTLAEIVGKNRGLTVKPSDANALANAITYLIDNREESVQLGINAKEFVSNLPSWNQITLQTINLLNQVHDTSVKRKIKNNLYQKLCSKSRWEIWKKGPQTTYRRIRRKIAYRLFGIRKFDFKNNELAFDLGIDDFGRDVAKGLSFYIQLLMRRGLKINTVIVLGSRAKGRWKPESDVDLVVIANNLPKGLKRKRILAEAPIFMDIQPDVFTIEEFLHELNNFNITILDAIFCGKVVYDNGFWFQVIERFKEMEEKYPLLSNIRDRLVVL